MRHLQNLLSNLSQREKFYFNSLNQGKNKANFWKIYNYLNKSPKATIIDLKQEFKGVLDDTNIRVEINYLYNHILRSLHVYRLNQSNSNNQYYFKQLSFAEILLEKNLTKEASKILRTLKKKALHYGELERVIDIIRLEEKLEEKILKIRSIEDLRAQSEEVTRIFDELQKITQLKIIKSELISIQYQKSVTKTDLNKLIKKVRQFLNSFSEEPFSGEGKNVWYSINQIYNQYLDNYELALKYSKLQLDNNIEHQQIFNDIQSMKVLNNYLYLNIVQGKYDEFNANYDKIERFNNSKELVYDDHLFFKTYLKIGMEIKMKNYKILLEMVYTAYKDLEKHFDMMQSAYRNELMQYIVIAAIMIQDYKFAKKILIQQSKYHNEEYSFVTSKMNRLVTYFSLEDKYLLKYELTNFKKAIDRKNIKNEVYKVLIQLFRKSISKKGHQIEDISIAINKLKKAKLNQSFSNFIVELDYLAWLESYQVLISNKKAITTAD